MFSNKLNLWFLSSVLISFLVIIPILTVSLSFFEDTSRYFEILKNTFLYEYILNSLSLLVGVLILTFIWNDNFWAIELTQGPDTQPVTDRITAINKQYRACLI